MIIAISGQKGGAGKSTIAVNLAVEWYERGFRVLLVDADPQATIRTWAAVAAEANIQTPTVVSMGEGLHKQDQLPALAKSFDLVLIDCPPRYEKIQRSALLVSDLVILPCGPSAVEAWAMAESLDLVESVQAARPDLRAVVAITRKVSRTTIGAEARGVLAESGLPVLETELYYRVAYQEAPAAGKGVVQYQPHGAASVEVRMLADEIEESEVKRWPSPRRK